MLAIRSGERVYKTPHPSITFFRVCAKSWQQANNWRSRGKRPEKSIECKKPSEFNFQIKGLWFSEIKGVENELLAHVLRRRGNNPCKKCALSQFYLAGCGLYRCHRAHSADISRYLYSIYSPRGPLQLTVVSIIITQGLAGFVPAMAYARRVVANPRKQPPRMSTPICPICQPPTPHPFFFLIPLVI